MIYRKPTLTDQYLDSSHHLEHTRSVVRTLLRKAETVVSDPSHHEVRHVKRALTASRYKKWSFKITRKKEKTADSCCDRTEGERVYPVFIPCGRGIRVPPVHFPGTRCGILPQAIQHPHIPVANVRPKDKTPLEKQCGLVYKVECGVCHKQYT